MTDAGSIRMRTVSATVSTGGAPGSKANTVKGGQRIDMPSWARSDDLVFQRHEERVLRVPRARDAVVPPGASRTSEDARQDDQTPPEAARPAPARGEVIACGRRSTPPRLPAARPRRRPRPRAPRGRRSPVASDAFPTRGDPARRSGSRPLRESSAPGGTGRRRGPRARTSASRPSRSRATALVHSPIRP